MVRRVAQVLYKIKPYDTNSPYPSITVGRLKKFTIDNTWRFMPPGLRTDPDEELEKLPVPEELGQGACPPPPEPVDSAPPAYQEKEIW